MNKLFARKFSCEWMDGSYKNHLVCSGEKELLALGLQSALSVSGDLRRLLLFQEASYVTYSLRLLATARVRSYSHYASCSGHDVSSVYERALATMQ